MKNFKKIKKAIILIKIFGIYIFSRMGIFFSFLIFLSFTDIPYDLYYNLGTYKSEIEVEPNIIVIMGGSGFPSSDGLLKTYFGAIVAKEYSDAKIIIALPSDKSEENSQQNLMKKELINRGIDSTRITFESLGYNTYSQAVNISKKFPQSVNTLCILIITTPEHNFRAVKTFQKVGFNKVYGYFTLEKPVSEQKLNNVESVEKKVENLDLRYNLWSYLNYEVLVIREYSAIIYYRIKNWI
jgi:uncharacterized SAM-binding protein YcdF (DUF218 family)